MNNQIYVNSHSKFAPNDVLHDKLIERIVAQCEKNYLNENSKLVNLNEGPTSWMPTKHFDRVHKKHQSNFTQINPFIGLPIIIANAITLVAAAAVTTPTTTSSPLFDATNNNLATKIAHNHLNHIIASASATSPPSLIATTITTTGADNQPMSDSDKSTLDNNYLLDEVAKILKLTDYCYVLSLITLVLALIIMLSFKQLRCPKNNIHIQLFISFIIRAGSHLIRRTTDVETIDSNSWSCKLVTSIWQYSLLANYSWILMEGLYLNNLIFSKKIYPHGPSILIYTICGWLTPLLCITPWIIVKSTYEDRSCWRDSTDGPYFWILRTPITISILINFSIYIKIILVLYSKIFTGSLQISTTSAKNNYKRLLRSTLVLIPLFGIHYTGLLLVQQWVSIATQGKSHHQAEIVQLYIETFISSLQGFIVALLYCFLNGEVHLEIKRLWWNSITNSN